MSQNEEKIQSNIDEIDYCTTWEVNGHTFAYDAYDADDAERFEKAVDELAESEKKIPTGKNSEAIKYYCNIFRRFFANIFGNEAANQIIAKDNSFLCNQIYSDFLTFIDTQKKASAEMTQSIKTKFQGNRAQRRVKK